MPSQTTPPVTVAKSQGGVLPISAVNDKHASKPASTQQRSTPQQRSKLVLRRLPPGLTHAELDAALGEAWKPGRGKVSWADFAPGKVSKDVSKPSRPARAYFQIPKPEDAEALAQAVAQTSFTDACATGSDPVLIGPPVLEYALYGRIPANKRRNDARQGTIDQDPEFVQFLESLTNPITKQKALETTTTGKDDAVTVTPLIQHLRDKKAAKEKAASNKAAKQQKQEPKETANESKSERKRGGRDAAKGADKENRPAKSNEKGQSGKDVAPKPTRGEKARQSTASTDVTAASPASGTAAAAAATSQNASSRRPENTSAAARIIQRDLGLRTEKRNSTKAARGGKNAQDTARSSTPTPSASESGSVPASPRPGREPASRPGATKDASSAGNAPAQSQAPAKSAGAAGQRQNNKSQPKSVLAQADSAATKAFLKHANPSQGITEAAIQDAMVSFGEVSHVDLDKRKGFAIVTFGAPASLQAAMSASPVTIGQGSVQVLEWKQRGTSQTNPPSGPAAMNGGPSANASARGGGRGNGSRGGTRGRGRGGGGSSSSNGQQRSTAGGTAPTSSTSQAGERANGASTDGKTPAPAATTGTTNGAT